MIETSKYKFKKSQTSDNIADVININEPANWDKAEVELEKINTATYSTVTKQEPVFSLGADAIKGQVPINAKGLSVVNIIKNGNFASDTVWAVQTGTKSVSNNVMTFTATAQYGGIWQNVSVMNTHKYYVVGLIKTSSSGVYLSDSTVWLSHSGSGNYEKISGITTAVASGQVALSVGDARTSSWDAVLIKNIMYIDLTAMFGSTIADALTKEQCDKMFAKWFDGLQGVNNVAVKSVGKNLFDKSKATYGYYVGYGSGALQALDNFTVSDYMPIKGNTNYVASGESQQLAFYDSNKQYISGLPDTGLYITTPINARFIRWSVSTATLNIAQLEEGTVATAYEPYVESISPLPKMHSLPNGVKDEIVDGKFIKRVGEYILKSTDVTTIGVTNTQYATIPTSVLIDIKPQVAGVIDNNVVFSTGWKEITTGIGNVGTEYQFATEPTTIYPAFPLNTYANLAAAQTALAGTKILYELAQPIVTDLVTPLTVFPQGTISVESDSETTIPELTLKYPVNVAGVVEQQTESINQLTKIINSLGV